MFFISPLIFPETILDESFYDALFFCRISISGKILILGSSFKMIFPIIIARFVDQQCFEMKLMGHF